MFCVLDYISNAHGVKVIFETNSIRVKLRRSIAKQSCGVIKRIIMLFTLSGCRMKLFIL